LQLGLQCRDRRISGSGQGRRNRSRKGRPHRAAGWRLDCFPPGHDRSPRRRKAEEAGSTRASRATDGFLMSGPGRRTAGRSELVNKVNENEKGCLLYQHYHGEVPNTYVFMERYADQTAVEAHRGTEYFKTLGRAMADFMDGKPTIHRLKQVGA